MTDSTTPMTQLYLTKDLVVNSVQVKYGSKCCRVPGDPSEWAYKVMNNGKHEHADLDEGWNELRLAKAIRREVLVTNKPKAKDQKKPAEKTENQKAIEADAKRERNAPRAGKKKTSKKKK